MSNGAIQGQTYLPLQGGELQGNVEMNGNKITGLGEAVNDGDAVNLKLLKNKTEFDNQGIFKFAKYAGEIPTGGYYNAVHTINFDWLPTMLIFKGRPYKDNGLTVYFYGNNNGTTQNSSFLNASIKVCDIYTQEQDAIAVCRLTSTIRGSFSYFQEVEKIIQSSIQIYQGFVVKQQNKYQIHISTTQEQAILKPLEVYYI